VRADEGARAGRDADTWDSPFCAAFAPAQQLEAAPFPLQSMQQAAPPAGFGRAVQLVEAADLASGGGTVEEGADGASNVSLAEYAAALYMYMRAIGYDSEDVCVLADSRAQVLALERVLAARCGAGCGMPRDVRRMAEVVDQARVVIVSCVGAQDALPAEVWEHVASGAREALLVLVPSALAARLWPGFGPASVPAPLALRLGEMAQDDLEALGRGDEYQLADGCTELGVIVAHLVKAAGGYGS
jgi:hypothetical protein